MKRSLFFLCLFGVCYSQETIPPSHYKTFKPKEPIITAVEAIKALADQATSFYVMCERFGVCYDVEFLQFTPEANEIDSSVEDICYEDSDCLDQFADCVDNRCQCKKSYVQQGSKCFGINNAKCYNSSQCVSTHLQCLNGRCAQILETQQGNNSCTTKNGMDVCWGKTPSKGIPNVICRGHEGNITNSGVSDTDYNRRKTCKFIWKHRVHRTENYDFLQLDGKIQWKNRGFTLDQAVCVGTSEGFRVVLMCQVEHHGIKYVGRLSPPNFFVCEFMYGDEIHESKTFDTLVYVP